VILAAHAYAGAVISGTKNERVAALVFVAALTPDEGETVADMFYRGASHPEAPQLAPDAHGLIWMPDSGFASAFAHRASAEQAALLAATQRPIHLACIQKKAGPPAWKRQPSWYLIAEEDRMIPQGTQRYMAQRMGARTRTAPIDHTPLVTAPDVVVEVLNDALTHLTSGGA
jgi:pimeloyl-ACP methyl ester carboxylesterase